MKRIVIISLLVLVSCKSSQDNFKEELKTPISSFEGKIIFSTDITTSEFASDSLQKKITDKYGDSLIMYYSKTGDFRRVHLNSSEFGSDSQLYLAKKGKLYFTKKNTLEIDSLDAQRNSIKKMHSGKIESTKIMGLDCECYEYIAIRKFNNREIILNYCFSLKSPKLNSDLFSKHNDFYLNEYYEIAKRPYLKFSLQTDKFKLTYTAIELIEMSIENDMFELK